MFNNYKCLSYFLYKLIYNLKNINLKGINLKLTIKHYWDFDVDFKEINKVYHGLIYFALKPNGLTSNDYKKTNFSFNPPIFKKLEKNKIYTLEFTSIDTKIIEHIKNIKYNNFHVVEILEDDNLITSEFLYVANYHNLLSESICKNWMIDMCGKKNIQFRKQHSIKLLKELIEVQSTILFKRHSDLTLEYNNKLDNGFEYVSFIKNIKIVDENNLHLKNNYVTTYNLLIEVELNRNVSKILNLILNLGLGSKSAYGLGFVKSITQKEYK